MDAKVKEWIEKLCGSNVSETDTNAGILKLNNKLKINKNKEFSF